MKQTNIYLIVFPRYNPTEVDGRNAAEPMEVHKQTRLKPTCRGGLDTDPTRTWWSQGVTHTSSKTHLSPPPRGATSKTTHLKRTSP